MADGGREPRRRRSPRGSRYSPPSSEQTIPWIDFGGLVRMLAEGIADAQRSLDQSSVAMAEELASTVVSVIPEVREVIDAEGRVTYEEADPQRMSLLDLGIMPTFYQFSKTTIEVAMDLAVVEEEEEQDSAERGYELLANTVDLQAQRKLDRKLDVHSKMTATLVPVPMPARLEPARTVVKEQDR